MVQLATPERGSPSEERYRHVFEDWPIGIWLVDGNLRTLEMNAAMSRTLGFTAEELGQRTLADVTHPDDLQSTLAVTTQLIAGVLDLHDREAVRDQGRRPDLRRHHGQRRAGRRP